MNLYEPEAHFVNKSGETLVGRDAVRKVVGGLIEAKTHFQSRVVRAVTLGDIAQLYTDFEGIHWCNKGEVKSGDYEAISSSHERRLER